MVDLDAVIDKSAWPCFTPGMHWALSDRIFDIGAMCNVDLDNDCIEYEIDVDDLPNGEDALYHFNAMVNIVVRLSDWPKQLAVKADTATLCVGLKALEQVSFSSDGKATFTMFTGSSILPLFVLGDDKLTVRVHFKGLSHDEACIAPQHTVDATGLLVRFKSKTTAFFVAACPTAVLTYDGQQWRVLQHASDGFRAEETEEAVRVRKVPRGKPMFMDDPFDADISVVGRSVGSLHGPPMTPLTDEQKAHLMSFADNDETGDFLTMWGALNGLNSAINNVAGHAEGPTQDGALQNEH